MRLLQRISQYISSNLETVRDVWAGMGSSRDGCLDPTELAAFLRRLVKGIAHREQHFILMHVAGVMMMEPLNDTTPQNAKMPK